MKKLQQRLCLAVAGVAILFAPGCGGSGDGSEPAPPPPPATIGFEARLTREGTLLTCTSSVHAPAKITRSTGGIESTFQMNCPSQRRLAGDYDLSQWSASFVSAQVGNPTARSQTWLPAPIVMREGATFIALPSEPVDALESRMTIERLRDGMPQPVTLLTPHRISPSAGDEADAWRYTLTQGGTTYRSPAARLREVTLGDFGVWGALALAEDKGPGTPRLHSSISFPANIRDGLRANRDFRDIRFVDLDNDGREDFVSTVYGEGCTYVAMAQPDGNYDVRTPRRDDGTCIGGHGETILVADFDGDGLVDIFLPSYERFDLLKNLGQGQFREVADSLGISFPNYLPSVEGAAAVDLDLNGTIDIVVASEVLLNDGRGHFRALAQPFGQRLFDEGMSVADIDVDGVFDIVKNDPDRGPRIYWGRADTTFSDAGWLFGGRAVAQTAYGIAVGRVTGSSLPDLLIGGGVRPSDAPGAEFPTPGEGPRMCVQRRPRSFDCFRSFLPAFGPHPSDLVMVTDDDGDGTEEVIHRQGTLRAARLATVMPQSVFRFDLRDADNRRTVYGRTVRARCVLDDSVVATKFVDGGNGYMAQGEYIVNFTSNWCDRIRLETGGTNGPVGLGEYGPGSYQLRLPATR